MTQLRMALMLTFTLTAGIIVGLISSHISTADQMPVKQTILIKTGLVGDGEREANMYVTEIAPGVDAGQHYHHAHTFVYVLDGSITVQEPGESPVTFHAGQAFHEPPMKAHDARNASTTAPLKILVFQAPKKGQPLAEMVK